jgi:hypothetical protein
MHATLVRAANIGASFHVVGREFMILTGRYNPDQGWFHFMDRAVFAATPTPQLVPYVRAKIPNKVFAQISEDDRKLYPSPKVAPGQFVLPFQEGKRVSNAQFKQMSDSGFTTWAKDSDGEICTVRILSADKRDDILAWCMDTCRHRFHLKGAQSISFESEIDALIAKMRFS